MPLNKNYHSLITKPYPGKGIGGVTKIREIRVCVCTFGEGGRKWGVGGEGTGHEKCEGSPSTEGCFIFVPPLPSFYCTFILSQTSK